jgi:hypothetical protein
LGEGEPEAVGHAREVVEDRDQVAHFEESLVVQAHIAQGLPVRGGHFPRCEGHLLCHGAEGTLPRRQVGELPPAVLLDRLDQLRIAVLDTQKL